jgi:hypothetical protein
MKICGTISVGNFNLNTQFMSTTHPLVSEFSKKNLSTFFVLPLLKLNKFRFGESNFVDTYLSTDSKFIVVKVLEKLFLAQSLTMHPNFVELRDCTEHSLLIYAIPKEFEDDVELFRQGAYSLFSKEAKYKIRRYSGLISKQIIDGIPHTDPRLLALDKDKALKDFWINLLWDNHYESIIEDTDELLSSPNHTAFINL